MGLDTVEIVLEVEDVFSISIPDYEASRILTVGDLYEYIIANTNRATSSSVCLSAVAFRSVLRGAKSLGVNDRLRPRDSTIRMLPVSHRREFWAALQNATALKLPPLRRPPWIEVAASVAVLVMAILVGHAVYRSTQTIGAAIVSTAIVGAIAGWVLLKVTVPCAVLPGRNFATLRGLIEAVLRLNFTSLSERHHGAHSDDVWITLRTLIVEQLGVSPAAVTPTARFVKDLGCG